MMLDLVLPRCIRMRNPDVIELFELVELGTMVEIVD
ncbi:MAG: L,D-transpeptidase family protein [Myxococcota bacterium]